MCNNKFMQKAKDRNLTLRLPIGLLRRLKEKSAAEGLSMNAYIEHALMNALTADQSDARRLAAERLLARAKNGLYEMDRPLTREEAHDRYA
jgi:hypothetical protein